MTEHKRLPVAWIVYTENGVMLWQSSDYAEACTYCDDVERPTPLYTEPPKREWVGLTEEEAADCWSTSAVKSWKNIEAKLKEKNT